MRGEKRAPSIYDRALTSTTGEQSLNAPKITIGDIPAWKPWTQYKVIEEAENVPDPAVCPKLPYMVYNYPVPDVKQVAYCTYHQEWDFHKKHILIS